MRGVTDKDLADGKDDMESNLGVENDPLAAMLLFVCGRERWVGVGVWGGGSASRVASACSMRGSHPTTVREYRLTPTLKLQHKAFTRRRAAKPICAKLGCQRAGAWAQRHRVWTVSEGWTAGTLQEGETLTFQRRHSTSRRLRICHHLRLQLKRAIPLFAFGCRPYLVSRHGGGHLPPRLDLFFTRAKSCPPPPCWVPGRVQ